MTITRAAGLYGEVNSPWNQPGDDRPQSPKRDLMGETETRADHGPRQRSTGVRSPRGHN